MGLRVYMLMRRVLGFGHSDLDLGFRISGLGSRIMVQSLGFRVEG